MKNRNGVIRGAYQISSIKNEGGIQEEEGKGFGRRIIIQAKKVNFP